MESIVVAIITSGLALVGVIMTNVASNKRMEQQVITAQAVMTEKIERLTEEVHKHNTFGDRITKLEVRIDNVERSVGA